MPMNAALQSKAFRAGCLIIRHLFAVYVVPSQVSVAGRAEQSADAPGFVVVVNREQVVLRRLAADAAYAPLALQQAVVIGARQAVLAQQIHPPVVAVALDVCLPSASFRTEALPPTAWMEARHELAAATLTGRHATAASIG